MIKRKTRHGIFFLAVLSITIWLVPKNSSVPVDEPPERLDTRLNFSLRDLTGQLLAKHGNGNDKTTSGDDKYHGRRG